MYGLDEDELERRSGMLLDQAKRLEEQVLGDKNQAAARLKVEEKARSETKDDVRKAEPQQWGWEWGKSNDKILQDKLDKAQRETEDLRKDVEKAQREKLDLRIDLVKAQTETEQLRKAAAQQWRWRCLEFGFIIVLVYALRR
ncbi:uncharacterized protein LOC141658709 [Silene latifolia]|uniref:uncharacterized protein LOC141658709 n=1 Tax=Silene latifolia TaxID=37657 RepID=UPI003D7871B8